MPHVVADAFREVDHWDTTHILTADEVCQRFKWIVALCIAAVVEDAFYCDYDWNGFGLDAVCVALGFINGLLCAASLRSFMVLLGVS